jgi:hypothetical protein
MHVDRKKFLMTYVTHLTSKYKPASRMRVGLKDNWTA